MSYNCKYCEVHSKELKPVTFWCRVKHWFKGHEWHKMGYTQDKFVHIECRICGKIEHDVGLVDRWHKIKPESER